MNAAVRWSVVCATVALTLPAQAQQLKVGMARNRPHAPAIVAPRPISSEAEAAYDELSPRFARETAFAVRVPAGSEVRLDPGEHDAHEWVGIDEALRRLPFAGLRRAVQLANSVGAP